VSLSDEEQGRLREIEVLTVAADPRFARRLDLDVAVRRRQRLRWGRWWLLALGAWLMIIGVGAAAGSVLLGMVVAGAGCGLMVWAALTFRATRPPRL
jgi:hypothetical protein